MKINKIKSILSSIMALYTGFQSQVWIGAVISFINASGDAFNMFIMIYLSKFLQLSFLHSYNIIMINGAGLILGSYIGGIICGIIKSYKIVICTLIVNAFSLFIIAIIHWYTVLLCISLILGISNGIFKPANRLIMLQNSDVSEQHRINSFWRMILNIGIGTSALLNGCLAHWYYPSIFYVNGFTSLLAIVILFYYKRFFLQKKTTNTLTTNIIELKIPNKTKFKSVIFVYVLLLLTCIVFFQVRSTYPLFLTEKYHFRPFQIGYLFTINSIIIILLEVPAAHILRNISLIFRAIVGSVLICFGMYILSFNIITILIPIISCIMWSFGEVLTFSPIILYIVEKVPELERGKYIGLYQTIIAIASLLSPTISGFIYTHLSAYFLWVSCGLLGVGILIFSTWYYRYLLLIDLRLI